MGRAEQAMDRDGSPTREFAFWLRDLRNGAGLTYDQLARRTSYSISTLQEAASGRRLPTIKVTLAIVDACAGDVEAWQAYWAQIKRIIDRDSPHGNTGESVAPPWAVSPSDDDGQGLQTARSARQQEAGPAQPGNMWTLFRRKKRLVLLSGALIVVTAGTIVAVSAASARNTPPAFEMIVVQNEVAIGSSTLIEDKAPAYLSAEAISRCAARGCKLEGTDMWSGAKLVASCWIRGEQVTNEDVTSDGIAENKNGVSSDLWYLAKWKDGRNGYISEVYIAPRYRGGLGLKECIGNS